MKTKTFFSLLFSCLFIFSSCSEDDEAIIDNPEMLSKIQGKWLLDGLTVNDNDFEEWPEEAGDTYFTFKPGGTLVVSDSFGDQTGTYELNGDKKITISIDGETNIFSITELTATKLRLSGRGDVDEEPGDDEVTFHFSKV